MNVTYSKSGLCQNGVIPYAVLLPFDAQGVAVQAAKSYSAHHGYSLKQCAASRTVTEEWVACDEVAKLLDEL
ncbi:hypothetical protein [Verrucomicrobium sp. BvORR034]|uniref:hypothetical protein n=1 Tax=Verrucomicrobium sp. BvORR034 TaxID=1396418 RepID=UPI002240F1E1|nr:hypothetical protein [Verrucomicrobium sp. BvORR034]